MMKLTISAAALIAVAALVTVPANADFIGGGPIKSKSGQCWKATGGGRDGTFGAWVECPKVGAANDVPCSAGQLAWEKAHTAMGYFDHCVRGGAAAAASGGSAAAKPAPTAQRATR